MRGDGARRNLDMPLTKKGRKVMKSMEETYGSKKAEQVFYASRNAGKLKGVDSKKRKGK
jgi:broad specificity phosphatase PhoE